MTPNEIAQIITLARRAPLRDMNEAEAASVLLQKLASEYAPKPQKPSTDEATQSDQRMSG